MAPEQALGESDIDARADVWSVGMMLFEMLTGSPAHVGGTAVAVLTKILTETAPAPRLKRPSVPRELDAVVTRALVIDREERYPSARAMLDALETVQASCGWDGEAPVFSVPGETARDPDQPRFVPKRTRVGLLKRTSFETNPASSSGPILVPSVEAGALETNPGGMESMPRARRIRVRRRRP
jgi:serine/threonine protein kinase